MPDFVHRPFQSIFHFRPSKPHQSSRGDGSAILSFTSSKVLHLGRVKGSIQYSKPCTNIPYTHKILFHCKSLKDMANIMFQEVLIICFEAIHIASHLDSVRLQNL